MTDREKRQHVIEVLQEMVDWMQAANYIVAKPERIHALFYAIASIKTDLKYDLLYEGVDCNNCKNNWHRGDGSTYCATGDGICHYECEEPTTKNDLGVDCINRAEVNQVIEDYIDEQYHVLSDRTRERAHGAKIVGARINELSSVTPQEPRKGHWEHGKELSKEYRGRILVDVTYADWHCSNCHCVVEQSFKPKWNYCPNCGAKMVEPQESEG